MLCLKINSKMNRIIFLCFSCLFSHLLTAQIENSKTTKDSLYVEEVQNFNSTDKVLHAEPLFIDLIRDLGARKGEREWNVGLGLTDNSKYDAYTTLVEYEWAPIDRLGLEIELPFSFYYRTTADESDEMEVSRNKLNSLKFAAQYSFYVSEKNKMSMAVGYIQEFGLTSFAKYGKENLFTENVYNPFFVAAKRWGNNYHTLVYTGPTIGHHFSTKDVAIKWQVNTNFHYMISGTRNFIGIEFNKVFEQNNFDMIIRPQMRVAISDQLIIGIVTGIPITKNQERLSSFLRLIYEPKHK